MMLDEATLAVLRRKVAWRIVPLVVLLCFLACAFTFWLPTTVKGISGDTVQATLLYRGLFYPCGLISVLCSGQSSDRSGDRKWHAAAGLGAAAPFSSL